MERSVSRRRRTVVLAVLAGAALLAAVVVHDVLAVDTRGATVRHITIESRFAHRSLRVTLVEPAGATSGRPLLVFLHGRGDKGEDSNVNDAFFRALIAQGDNAPAVVFPNGGNHGYWHDRRGAKWARYVLDEVIPRALDELEADPKRVAIGGISMGGFGALDIARLHPHRFCAVGAHSPALWQTGGETAPGAFDDAQDFSAPRRDRERAAQPWPVQGHAGLARRGVARPVPAGRPRPGRRIEPRAPAHLPRRPRGRLLARALPRVPALLRQRPRALLGRLAAVGDAARVERARDERLRA